MDQHKVRIRLATTWVLKASDGHGAYWTKGFALADDFEDSDDNNVLTFYEAQDAARLRQQIVGSGHRRGRAGAGQGRSR